MGNPEEIKGSRIFEECSQTFPNIINLNIYVNLLQKSCDEQRIKLGKPSMFHLFCGPT